MNNRSIRQKIAAPKVNMGGHWLDQPLPVHGLDYVDPFLLIHHWKNTMPGDQKQREVGVGPHPHRGFSPVTIVFEGAVEHRDTLGNRSVVEKGGVQWMNAGKGLNHSERPSKELAEKGGNLEFIQFWVNSPAQYKMQFPEYMAISKQEIPEILGDDFNLGLIAGEYVGQQGKAHSLSPLLIMRGEAKKGAEVKIEIPKNYNVLVYFLNGESEMQGTALQAKDMVYFNQDGDSIFWKANSDQNFLLLSGEPLNEPVSAYGPFVMNTKNEIVEALNDAQAGRMGYLVEDFD